MLRFRFALLLGLLVVYGQLALALQPLDPDAIPEPLRPWQDWVLHDNPERRCPVRHASDERDCIWPGELSIEADRRGGRFSQSLSVYATSRVQLPGDTVHWPIEVRSGDTPLAVVEEQGRPHVLLQPGRYIVSGRFTWEALPSSLEMPAGLGIVRYVRDGAPVSVPQYRDGKLWLRDRRTLVQAKTPEDRINIEVYRLVRDGHPGRVVTHLALEVSGRQRETLLGTPLLPGLVPLRVDSPLPARLEPDGRLRLQVRPGRFELRVHARAPAPLTELTLASEPPISTDHRSEVWVYQASPQDRLTEIRGVPQVDPRQVRLPKDWANLPAYRVDPGAVFEVSEIRRGDPHPEPDDLTLSRDLWLDFDGGGFTVRDRLGGRMTSGWRLSVDDRFDLGRVAIGGKPQFITRLPGEDRDGVEVRRGALDLVAESRVESAAGTMPAVGWGRDVQSLDTQLHLPPGYQLVAVTGVDNVPSSWLQRWTLYDIFLVLIIALGVGRLWGWRWFPLAVVTLALMWHEPAAPRLVWLYLLAVVALIRVVPESSRFLRLLKNLRWLGFVALLVIALPFAVQQAREGLYPQLEQHWRTAQPPTSRAVLHEQRLRTEAETQRLRERTAGAASDLASSAKSLGLAGRAHYSSSAAELLDEVDPSATIQTGPGLPDWHWRTISLSWNGPVSKDQQIRLWLLSPFSHGLLTFVTLGLLLLLAWRFLDLEGSLGRLRASVLFVALLGLFPGAGSTAEMPPAHLLEQLKERLLVPQTKAPRAAIPQASLTISPDRYLARLDVQTLAETAVPLPVDPRVMIPRRVWVGGQSAVDRVFRTADHVLWLLVPEGRHEVRLEAVLPPLDQIQVPFPLLAHRVIVDPQGWSVDGFDADGRVRGQLSLVRLRESVSDGSGELTPAVLPPFLTVERTLRFGLQWEVLTRVVRASPPGAPISMKIPVVPGASVVTGGVTVRDAEVLVELAASQREVRWRSRLDPVDRLVLTAPDTRAWIEAWRADVGPQWHVDIEGIPPIHHQDDARNWLPAWHPWPGESVVFSIRRPEGVAGRTATIDQSTLTVRPGKRATDTTLSFQLRSSQGGQRAVVLPDGAQLQSVKVNGTTQPIRQEGAGVTLPVVPGEQSYELLWREMAGITGDWSTPSVGLCGPSVNARIRVEAPRDRWSLWFDGPRLGPAVLFWGVLSVLVLVSVLLGIAGRRHFPVGVATWLLLGLGLTQVSVFGLLAIIGWFVAIRYRALVLSDGQPRHGPAAFNLLQIGIVMLSIISASVLLGAVQNGLLGQPAMQIQGNDSSAYVLNWYQDRVSEKLPQATVYSVPLWVYRLLMMAWALWLAFSVLSWIKWGWRAFADGGLWRATPVKWNRWRRSQGQGEGQSPPEG